MARTSIKARDIKPGMIVFGRYIIPTLVTAASLQRSMSERWDVVSVAGVDLRGGHFGESIAAIIDGDDQVWAVQS